MKIKESFLHIIHQYLSFLIGFSFTSVSATDCLSSNETGESCVCCCVDNVFTYLQCCLNMAHDPTKHENRSWNKKSAECPTAQQRLKWELVPGLVFEKCIIVSIKLCSNRTVFCVCVYCKTRGRV